MSLDIGIYAKKTKKNWLVYEINFSTKEENLIKKYNPNIHDSMIRVCLERLDNKIIRECGSSYENSWIIKNMKEKNQMLMDIDNMKSETKVEIKNIIDKATKKNNRGKFIFYKLINLFK